MTQKLKGFGHIMQLTIFNQVLSSDFQQEGITHESFCINTPKQNEIVEKKNGIIITENDEKGRQVLKKV